MKPIDKTGRDRIVRNLTARWIGQIVVIISGFVIPRQIDAELGPVALGIWDFGWSTVNYFSLFGFGLAGGLSRFVAVYNAEDADDSLRRAVSSTMFMTILISLLVAITTAVLTSFLPDVFDTIPPEDIADSQILVLFFGLTVAFRMLCWPARSILTGYHLTTITSMVTAGGDLVMLLGLFGVLFSGGGLAELGMVVLGTSVLTEVIRIIMARRIYQGPILERASLDREMMLKMFVFGMKNNISGLPHIIVIQSTNLVLAATAGPAALAVFARPLALCHLIARMVRQYANLLTPVAGGMQGLKRHDDMLEFFLSSLRVSAAMAIPPLLLLGTYGDLVIELWMNKDYVVPLLCPLMSLAFFLPVTHSAAMRILAGLDAHGKVAVRSLVLSTAVFGIALAIAIGAGLDVIGSAIVVGLGLTAGPGFVVMVSACKQFEVGVFEYLRQSMLPPMLCNLPLLAIVVASRLVYPDLSFLGAAFWGLIGSSIVVFCYWRYLFTEEMRSNVLRRIPGFT